MYLLFVAPGTQKFRLAFISTIVYLYDGPGIFSHIDDVRSAGVSAIEAAVLTTGDCIHDRFLAAGVLFGTSTGKWCEARDDVKKLF